MKSDAEEIGKALQDIAVRYGAEVMQTLLRYNEFWQQVAGGELDQETLREEYLRVVRDETNRYLRNLATFSASYYNAWLELGRTFNPPFFDGVFTSAARSTASASASPAPVKIGLTAPIGQDARDSLTLENKEREPDQVSFFVSEFKGPAGTVPFRPPLELQPPRFVLGPGEKREVRLRLPLLAELFQPNQQYTTTIAVRCHHPFDVLVEVSPTAAAASDAPGPSCPKQDDG